MDLIASFSSQKIRRFHFFSLCGSYWTTRIWLSSLTQALYVLSSVSTAFYLEEIARTVLRSQIPFTTIL